MQPLTKKEAFEAITTFIRASEEVLVIAPYFGRGAFNELGFSQSNKKSIIVCDLFSGACNPKEIAHFLERWGAKRVRTLDRLHAKIYWTGAGVVVGSANPSANGLGFEAGEASGLFEACVASSDPLIVETWRAFIEREFIQRSREVAAADIKAATPIWLKNRDKRPPRSSDPSTVLTMMQSNPDFFRDREVKIIAYVNTIPSKKAQQTFSEQKQAHTMPRLDFWENWQVPGGTTVVEFLFENTESSTPSFNGVFQTLPKPIVKLDGGGTITLCTEVERVCGLKLPASEQNVLAELMADLPDARTPEGALISVWDLARIVADPRPAILKGLNQAQYYSSVIENMMGVESGECTVRFGTVGEGKHPNYQVTMTNPLGQTQTQTFRGANHQPHDMKVFKSEHLTNAYSIEQIRAMLAHVLGG